MPKQREDGPYVLTIDGRSWALGLAWQVVTTPGVNLRKRALQDAREAIDTELYCVPQTLTPCFGLGTRRQGHRSGMPSAAASLARSMPGHWVGAFELPGKIDRRTGLPLFWLVAVRQEGIDPRTDVIGSEADIRDQFRHLITDGSPRWYAPRDWQVGGSPLDLATQLARGPRLRLAPTRLLPHFERRVWIRAAAAVATVAVLGGGLQYRRELLRAADEQARRAARDAPAIKRPEIVLPPDEPWNREASASRWAASCIDAMRDAVIAVPGWRWVEANCDGTRASASYARQDGSLALAKAWWATRPPGRAVFRASRADLLTLDVPMRGLVARTAEQPATRDRVTASLLDPLDAARLTATATDLPSAEPPAVRDTGTGPITRRLPGAPSLQVALSNVQLPLDEIAAAIARVPAATLRDATLRNAGAGAGAIPAWSATALVYFRR
ncbi:type 4b pilus protein PilO2 [Roseiterribacter gracilis]|uniref:Uncharacterized protein n=1 Tax=Roseiterribacter gracilis TaxID=2812848 RepID=A0A8S8XET8_9PROT|nr:hypothetical protein TMPK1_26780 [Rhodospirillales bacterium TMPK1]